MFAVERRVDLATIVLRVSQQATNFAFVVFAGGQTPGCCCLYKRRVGAAIAECIGNGITRLARRQHSSTMLIDLASTKFQAVKKLGFQQHGNQHLSERLFVRAEIHG